MLMARVVVGLSGGVDSSVAAHLLQQSGHEVIGLFMRNWTDESPTLEAECPWIEDSNDALLVAEKLGIPFQVLDLSSAYKTRIVDYMFAEYQAGRTPNPDVLCNREIKFDLFLEAALSLGADYVATGHYAQKTTSEDGMHHLLAGADGNKDQSYFLCQLNQTQLSKALFPIGHLPKPEVRRIAKEAGLVTAEKKDSQGLCFIGKVRLPDFLQQQLSIQTGQIIEVSRDSDVFKAPSCGQPWPLKADHGTVVGSHPGAHFFTVGQRKGLLVGGKPLPLFVLATDVAENIVYVGQGEDHPGLYRPCVWMMPGEVHWVRPDLALQPGESLEVSARIRYRQALVPARLTAEESGLALVPTAPFKSVAPGQFAAWYVGDELIGSGIIYA
ncbi:MAG: tRNA 2-thiouridine(34) synthase MnmA [Flavobacteriia bacterium]|nr:tRNA 2-thiouridine(34) synthase MnmA [Flavobacteriia bacterium]NDA07168.1 tRNA 2-thiouridine(34) synthase MnmA [Flavobacteriia bacterium]NDA28000.1 tRNA 2-thiouridine(34) synthase MnmA [Flavobacteriia bacterium]NDD19929.1 tRNA 2-thiouridine(34) synthase MnmA [Flavobacteriia bacterium]NDD80195.1 tRNA 2-thiouridine(34) synthase MnmA [Flavobacteriia bacterium]